MRVELTRTPLQIAAAASRDAEPPKSLSLIRAGLLPASLPPRGLCRELAAAYIGVGGSKFDEMVREGLMPKPRVIGSRRLWDRPELDIAFSNLPHADEGGGANPWDDVRV